MREIVSCDMDIEVSHSCHKWKTQGFHDPELGKKMPLIWVGGKWRECAFFPACLFFCPLWLLVDDTVPPI